MNTPLRRGFPPSVARRRRFEGDGISGRRSRTLDASGQRRCFIRCLSHCGVVKNRYEPGAPSCIV